MRNYGLFSEDQMCYKLQTVKAKQKRFQLGISIILGIDDTYYISAKKLGFIVPRFRNFAEILLKDSRVTDLMEEMSGILKVVAVVWVHFVAFRHV